MEFSELQQLATKVIFEADVFYTNDKQLSQFNEIPVVFPI